MTGGRPTQHPITPLPFPWGPSPYNAGGSIVWTMSRSETPCMPFASNGQLGLPQVDEYVTLGQWWLPKQS